MIESESEAKVLAIFVFLSVFAFLIIRRRPEE